MKNADLEFVVVPVLPSSGRSGPSEAAVPVPSTVVISIAYCTWESRFWLSTWCCAIMGSCTGPSGACHDWTMCAWWYMPPSLMVDSMVACSLTVSEPVPSAMPTWPTRLDRFDPLGNGAMLTPMFCAIWMMARVPARWARSV